MISKVFAVYWVGHGGVGGAVFSPLLLHILLECGVDHCGQVVCRELMP